MKKTTSSPWETVEATLEEIIKFQQKNLLECGRRIIPTLTPEDMLQPNDYPELENNPYFRYEEGTLAGMQSIQTALRALRKDCEALEETRNYNDI